MGAFPTRDVQRRIILQGKEAHWCFTGALYFCQCTLLLPVYCTSTSVLYATLHSQARRLVGLTWLTAALLALPRNWIQATLYCTCTTVLVLLYFTVLVLLYFTVLLYSTVLYYNVIMYFHILPDQSYLMFRKNGS